MHVSDINESLEQRKSVKGKSFVLMNIKNAVLITTKVYCANNLPVALHHGMVKIIWLNFKFCLAVTTACNF